MAEGPQSDVDVDREPAKSAVSDVGSDPAILAAGASVLLALYTYYVRGNEQQGIFVGHWAPTILAFASYLRQKDIDEQLDRAT
jgi:hypothetical protein